MNKISQFYFNLYTVSRLCGKLGMTFEQSLLAIDGMQDEQLALWWLTFVSDMQTGATNKSLTGLQELARIEPAFSIAYYYLEIFFNVDSGAFLRFYEGAMVHYLTLKYKNHKDLPSDVRAFLGYTDVGNFSIKNPNTEVASYIQGMLPQFCLLEVEEMPSSFFDITQKDIVASAYTCTLPTIAVTQAIAAYGEEGASEIIVSVQAELANIHFLLESVQ